MRQVTFSNVQIRVEKGEDGDRAIVIQDFVALPAGPGKTVPLPTDIYVVPLDAEIAEALAKDLGKASDITIAPANALRGLKA
jgi:hypothetical protein